jgi:hypothetical protein
MSPYPYAQHSYQTRLNLDLYPFIDRRKIIATPLWRKCEVTTHTLEKRTWESSETPENLGLDCRGQNTLHWGVFYTVGKILKCRCPKWPAWVIWTSAAQVMVKRRVGNWPDPGVCRWSATHHWKDLEESYKFDFDLISIGGQSWELWASKVLGVQTGTVSGLHLGSPGTKSHSDAGVVGERKEYYMGEGGGFP